MKCFWPAGAINAEAPSAGHRGSNGGSGDGSVFADEAAAHAAARDPHDLGVGGNGGEGQHSSRSAAEPGPSARSQQQASHALPTRGALMCCSLYRCFLPTCTTRSAVTGAETEQDLDYGVVRMQEYVSRTSTASKTLSMAGCWRLPLPRLACRERPQEGPQERPQLHPCSDP